MDFNNGNSPRMTEQEDISSSYFTIEETWSREISYFGHASLFLILNISFYLMQHTPLWRSKFRILRIKKTRTKIGTLKISHTGSKLHRDIPSGSFTKTDLRKIGAITDKAW